MALNTQVIGGFKTGMDQQTRQGGKEGAQTLWSLKNGFVNARGDVLARPGLTLVADVTGSAGLYGFQGQLHVFYGSDDSFVDPGNALVKSHLVQYPLQEIVLSGNMPDGAIGEVVDFQYSANGGSLPLVLSISSGSLPAGLSMNDTGHVTGTRTTGGIYTFVVRAVDSEDNVAVLPDTSDTTFPTLTLTGSYSDASIGNAYQSDLAITGGDGSYSNPQVTVGTLPSWATLSIAGSPGAYVLRLSGTPTGSPVTASFTVSVDSGDGQAVTSPQSITVAKYDQWNPLDVSDGDAIVSNGNRTLSTTQPAKQAVVRAKDAYSTGKFYYETVFAHSGALFNESVGINELTGAIPDREPGSQFDSISRGYGYIQSGLKVNNQVYTSYGPGFSGNDVVMVAVDLAGGELWFGKNGTWFSSGNPATGANPSFTIASSSYAPCINVYTASISGTSNFTPSDFVYAPPAGFKAWGSP